MWGSLGFWGENIPFWLYHRYGMQLVGPPVTTKLQAVVNSFVCMHCLCSMSIFTPPENYNFNPCHGRWSAGQGGKNGPLYDQNEQLVLQT